MSTLTKLIIVLIFGAWGVGMFAAARTGLGVRGLDNPQTRTVIKQNCPNYYGSPNGDCLRRTFRSYFLVRSIRGGGFGGGK